MTSLEVTDMARRRSVGTGTYVVGYHPTRALQTVCNLAGLRL